MSLRVLLVEDDRELRATLRAALAVEGYEVLAAASLADARAQLAVQGVDLLILDLGLPDGDGAQLLTELRKRSQVPVIIISARHDERPKIGLLDAGAADVRLTPTEFSLLARLVRSAGRVVTHRQLLADVWGAEHVDNTQYLRLYMSQLRAKLELTPADPQFLLTEPGVGYRLADPQEE